MFGSGLNEVLLDFAAGRSGMEIQERLLGGICWLWNVAGIECDTRLATAGVDWRRRGSISTDLSSIPSTMNKAVPRRPWGIAILLGFGVLVNYFDRLNLSVSRDAL